jgi:hypothetical protein
MPNTKDPLAKSLDATETKVQITNQSKIEVLFGDRPEVKEAIIRARKRRLSFNEIAVALNQEPNVKVSGDIVSKWLKGQGIK